MSYIRVIPRDLFNEAKLLKCLGMLSLYWLNNTQNARSLYRIDFNEECQGGFDVCQDLSSGDIYSENVTLERIQGESENVFLSHPLNNNSVNPLHFTFRNESWAVFDDAGLFTTAFISAMEGN